MRVRPSRPMDFRKRSLGFIVAESKTRLLYSFTRLVNRLGVSVSTRNRALSDFAMMVLSEPSEERRLLRKSPTLVIDVGRFLPVAIDCQATPEQVESSNAMFGSHVASCD